MSLYEKYLEDENNSVENLKENIVAVLEQNGNEPMSLKDFFKAIDRNKYSAGNIALCLNLLYHTGELERVKGELKQFGCMVKPETLYKIAEG